MKKQKQQSKILIGWTFAWCASTAILSYGVNFLWDSLIITTTGLIINLAIGVGMIIANKNLFKYYDELQKKIHFEAMAITAAGPPRRPAGCARSRPPRPRRRRRRRTSPSASAAGAPAAARRCC